jgi:hypothetical protein
LLDARMVGHSRCFSRQPTAGRRPMHPACKLCRGACCESVVLDQTSSAMVNEFLRARGRQLPGYRTEIESRCPHLVKGACDCHASRPVACQLFAVGGAACRETVLRRRAKDAGQIIGLLDTAPLKPCAKGDRRET